MKVFITGGAGFIGSHLAERLIERGDSVLVLDDLSTGEMSNLEPLVGKRSLRLPRGLGHRRAPGGRAARPLRRDGSPGGGRGRQADRGASGAHDRDQRARDRSRAALRCQEAKARRHRLDLGGVRQGLEVPVRGERRPGDGRHGALALGLCLLEGAGRVVGAGLLEREEGPGDDLPLLQHRRSAPDRPLRHGAAQFRRPSPAGRANHRVRHGRAVALFRTRSGRRRVDRPPARHRSRLRRGLQHRR